MKRASEAYALRPRQGWVYRSGVDFVVKARERGGAGFAVLEYTTTEDEWPGHTHHNEDEAFYVLEGSLTFRCGDREFDVDEGGFVFLPSGIQHGYKLRNTDEVRLLVITAPVVDAGANGWDGFIGSVEADEDSLVLTPD